MQSTIMLLLKHCPTRAEITADVHYILMLQRFELEKNIIFAELYWKHIQCFIWNDRQVMENEDIQKVN